MRERAASVGGTLKVQSLPETGTCITIRVPRTLKPFVPTPLHTADGRALRIMLVDDHPLFLDGLRNMLSARGVQVVGMAHDGSAALPLAHQLRPDVILMDVNMPGCDGVQATRNILAELPEQKIVMFTVAADDDTLFAALKAGASGYLLKSLDSATLFQLLTDLMQGEIVIAPSLASRVLREFAQRPQDAPPHRPAPSEQPLAAPRPDETPPTPTPDNALLLTERQIEVLRLVAEGLTYRAVALQLNITERTVKYHMGQILKRLQVQSRAEAIAYAAERGLTIS